MSPRNMVNESNEELELKFELVTNSLHAHSRITSVVADAAKEEFELFFKAAKKDNASEFNAYNQESERLDTFLHKFIAGKGEYNSFGLYVSSYLRYHMGRVP